MKRLLALVAALAATAGAASGEAVELYEPGFTSTELGGGVKTWFVGSLPYRGAWPSDDASAQGLAELRLQLQGRIGARVSWELQPLLSAATRAADRAPGLALAGAGQGSTPQAVDLSRTLASGMGLGVRLDRASVRLRLESFELTVGRQAISFGSTFFFTPLDLVAPFAPTALDRRYKPGIDALRADAFFGVSGQATLVAAYAGDWELEGAILLARAKTTFGLFDLGLLAGLARRDLVVGLDSAGELGGFGVRAEGTFTVPHQGSGFGRAALGVDRRVAGRLTLLAELYLQTLGATKPGDYLALALDARHRRGELWALGRTYGALSASWELLPIVEVSLAAVANLADPSVLLSPTLAWSVADEAELVAGAFLTVGERPAARTPEPSADPAALPLEARSEFGLAPHGGYLGLKAYF
jgi:hypothetical protein